jgi:hypothetical protein
MLQLDTGDKKRYKFLSVDSCGHGGMADTYDSGSYAERCEGSSPFARTINLSTYKIHLNLDMIMRFIEVRKRT